MGPFKARVGQTTPNFSRVSSSTRHKMTTMDRSKWKEKQGGYMGYI